MVLLARLTNGRCIDIGCTGVQEESKYEHCVSWDDVDLRNRADSMLSNNSDNHAATPRHAFYEASALAHSRRSSSVRVMSMWKYTSGLNSCSTWHGCDRAGRKVSTEAHVRVVGCFFHPVCLTLLCTPHLQVSQEQVACNGCLGGPEAPHGVVCDDAACACACVCVESVVCLSTWRTCRCQVSSVPLPVHAHASASLWPHARTSLWVAPKQQAGQVDGLVVGLSERVADCTAAVHAGHAGKGRSASSMCQRTGGCLDGPAWDGLRHQTGGQRYACAHRMEQQLTDSCSCAGLTSCCRCTRVLVFSLTVAAAAAFLGCLAWPLLRQTGSCSSAK